MSEAIKTDGNVLFPVFLKLNQLQTVVVGGGNVGLEKVEALLKNDPNARIRVIAPEIKTELRAIAAQSEYIEIVERKVRGRDLRKADLLILATDNYSLHERLKQKAKRRRLLTNVADTPNLCDFYLGSTVKKGDLKIGISTNGKSPTFAKRFRQTLEEILPESTPELLNQLKTIRDRLKGDFQYKVDKLNEITSVMVNNENNKDEHGERIETH
ncbi:precorrin-2 dehydrogenase/sirohydrochlorin ferrochelatase family protein [Marinoscillum furvescens]|uniref:precorrin-2 dehydrogenase n=1 Tax=Marinoscillum furvescens DSM 4134 TaxID=1122208 RepID=A0A3D9L4P0_MARFU|nr:bifunctional precorrin-2 dehydrogenase/sirohydrochlorin ferrochelatase [Marinoscillum furvescens]REE00985.1 precorrin-2 dehydrogenase/sirohydrochlorin ferrochelatase [Marinoscillum furvescens DSM 4134]